MLDATEADILTLLPEEGETFLCRSSDIVGRQGRVVPLTGRTLLDYRRPILLGLRPWMASEDGTSMLLGRPGHVLSRLPIEEDGSWQLDGTALVALTGALVVDAGRRGFYPRHGGRLVRISGTGEAWLAAGGSGASLRIVTGREVLDASYVLGFHDMLDTRSRHERLGRTTVTFTGGNGSVLLGLRRRDAS